MFQHFEKVTFDIYYFSELLYCMFRGPDLTKAGTRTLMGEGGGCKFMYSGYARRFLLKPTLLQKKSSRAEPEYMNIHTPNSVLAPALDLTSTTSTAILIYLLAYQMCLTYPANQSDSLKIGIRLRYW